MKVFREPENLPPFRNGVLTIGTFDGVHVGHQKIIQRIKEIANEKNGETIILTFEPHPRLVLNPGGHSVRLLTSLEEKIVLLHHYGIDNLIIAPFSVSFSQISPKEYIQDFLFDRIKPVKVVIGYDHRFGKNREGSIESFKEFSGKLGFEVEEIPKQIVDDITVSSTKIRRAVDEGDVRLASHLLGHLFSLEGIVVKGDQIGKKIGYPTANIQVMEPYKLLPGNGVYAVWVEYRDKKYGGMLNIGTRPTFNGTGRTIEVNIFDFNKDIYGEKLKVEFVSFIRDEVKFNTTEELIAELKKDEKKSKELLNLEQ